jgi:hypothetical protein
MLITRKIRRFTTLAFPLLMVVAASYSSEPSRSASRDQRLTMFPTSNGTLRAQDKDLPGTHVFGCLPYRGSPVYCIEIIGVESVLISDEFGHSNTPIDDIFALPVPGMTYQLCGDKCVRISVRADQTYVMQFDVDSEPLALEILKGAGKKSITESVRYVDLELPKGSKAMIKTTPRGVTDLKYDSKGGNAFDSVVKPTARLTGLDAQDIEPPKLEFDITKQQQDYLVKIVAEDAASGLKSIYYSFDGTHFQQYYGPFVVAAHQSSTLHAFADDNAGNRSPLLTQKLDQ